MNINNNQTENNAAQCCVDYCRTSFDVEGQEVVNNYKCNQKQFSTSDMWNIQRNIKQSAIRSSAL